MPASASTLLGRLLNSFIFTLSGGYARSVDEVFWLLSILATIELVVAATAWGLYRSPVLAELFWKILGFAFLFWLVSAWPQLLGWLRDGFIESGLLVGGNVLSLSDITDPGNIVDFGFSVTALLFGKLSQLNLLTNGFLILIGGISGELIILCYMVIAAHIFKAILEYYIAGACLLFLIPFLAHQKTAFAGERVFGTFIAHAMRLLIYAAILSSALPILYEYKLSNDPTLGEVGMLLAASLTMFVIALSAPAMANGLVRGAPVLSFGSLLHGGTSLLQTSAAIGAVGAAVSVAGAGALRAGLSGASAMHAAAQIGAGAFRATHMTSTSAGGRGSSAMLGASAGVVTYAANRLTSGFRAAIAQGRTRAHNAP